ncbi:MAG TPA: RNA polymerase sigma factor [Candidatus Coproplasma stercoripullorum]|uniref:RNA polymerase sigma factor n=1 Tax=Candidatus Coproplasma stercoripullorum TaxID=2840751 RepID=A0A9D1DAT0_9FIRM|nr:RNA polymerase sigma factor [Candidatus Coproplasma stercoripullorum]
MKKDGKEGHAQKFNSLISKIAKGEKGAFEEFYGIFGKFIVLAAKTVTGEKEFLDEAVDDVLVKIWNAAPSMPHIKNPFGWLYTVAVNCAKDRRKSGRIYEDIGDIAVEDGGIAAVENSDSFTRLLSGLDDDERQIILMHICEDLSFKDIARALARPLSSVTSVYYRSLSKIRNCFK